MALTLRGISAGQEPCSIPTTRGDTPPPNSTLEELEMARRVVAVSNEAIFADALSDTGRVSTAGALRAEASVAAQIERRRALAAGTPYQGVVGHIPDATWTGTAQPYTWMDLTDRLNKSLGSQARWYPVGYRPTGFKLLEDSR